MHAKDTPFQSLIYKISNISGALKARPPRAVHNSRLKAQHLTNHYTHGTAASYLTTNFAGTPTGRAAVAGSRSHARAAGAGSETDY
jgi:hypothetical protein